MIGTLLLIFGIMQIVGSPSSLFTLTGLVALIMPAIVTSIDVDDHLREGRGLFGHKANCWMEEKTHVHKTVRRELIQKAAVAKEDSWSSR